MSRLPSDADLQLSSAVLEAARAYPPVGRHGGFRRMLLAQRVEAATGQTGVDALGILGGFYDLEAMDAAWTARERAAEAERPFQLPAAYVRECDAARTGADARAIAAWGANELTWAGGWAAAAAAAGGAAAPEEPFRLPAPWQRDVCGVATPAATGPEGRVSPDMERVAGGGLSARRALWAKPPSPPTAGADSALCASRVVL